MLNLLSRLPFPILYLFSNILFVVTYYLLGYRKEVVWKNSFPDKEIEELRLIQRRFYRNLCDYGMETIKLLTISQAALRSRMTFKNPEILQPFADRHQSVILLASNQINWEWLLVAGSFSLPMQVDFVYQEQKSKFFNGFSLQTRTRFGAYPIKREAVGRESIRRKNILRGIAVVADQFPGQGQNKRYWTKYLNQETAFFYGIGQLAVLMQYPVVFFSVKKVKRGYYQAEGTLISLPPYEHDSNKMVDEYAHALEKSIQKYPDNWLWSHKRWKNIQ